MSISLNHQTNTIATGTNLLAMNTTVEMASTRRLGVQLGSQSEPSIYFIGDDNTGIYSPGANTVVLTVGNTNQFQVQFPSAANADIIMSGTGALLLQRGTTGQRPSSGIAGMIRYNTSIPQLEAFVNSSWIALQPGTVTSVNITQPAAGITATNGPITTTGSITLALANDLAALEGLSGTGVPKRTGADTWAVGTILASDVSDFDTQVRTNRLDQMAAPTASVSLNSQKITNLAEPTVDSDAATKFYVDNNGGGGSGVGSITLTQPAAGLTVTNSGVAQTGAASFTFALANDLAALEALSGTGVPKRTGADTWAVGTIVAADVSDFDTQVRTNRLDQMAAPTATVSMNNQVLSDLAAPSNPNDAARKAYVDQFPGTVTSITLTQPAAGITITNSGVAITSSGTRTFALADDLAAVEGISTTGVVQRTATDTWTAGTILASSVSNFDTQVRTNRLDQMAAPTAAVSLNNQRITNLATPTSGGDAVTKAYVDGLNNGKSSVRAATTANITLSGTQTVDGVSLNAGDRVLVKNQSSQPANGIYVVDASTWPRAGDADAWDELVSAYVFVDEGTVNTDTGWLCSVDAGGTLETTAVTWVKFSDRTESFIIAASDETTTLTSGAGKITFRMPYALTLTEIPRASLTTASSSGLVTVDINEGGASILSTKVTIDANEKTSTTAATAAVLSDTELANDAEITIDIDGAGTNATGLKVTIIGRRNI